MKKITVNIFATTGISLLLLAIVAMLFQAKCIYLQTVFQVLGANSVIHFCLLFVSKLEMKYAILEVFLDMVLIISMLIIFGSVFHWFTSTPIWILSAMGFVIYLLSVFLNLFYMRQEAREINALIKKRNITS